jgi:[acyl-carrier-protein] S-malonyltransferase
VLAILAPGQGSQRAGFLDAWLTEGARHSLAHYAEQTGVDLVAAGTTMSDEQITDTAVAQPLIVAASLLSASRLPDLPVGTVYAGHSVGEFAATALAGVMSPDDALRVVATRGTAMAAAGRSRPGSMVAVLGGDPEVVTAAIERSGCTVANANGAGQLVAAGPVDAVERLLADPPEGARMRQLAVAGAFHTSLMAPARDTLAAAANGVSVHDAEGGVVSNADGTLVTDGGEVLRRLVEQVSRPVRWDACMRTLGALGVTATIELAPAGTLTSLVRRALPGVDAVALKTPDDLDEARRVIVEHADDLAEETLPWQVVVSPTRGTVRVGAATAGSRVQPGTLLGNVAAARGEPVGFHTVHGGRLVEWLVSDGDPVADGQPLARLAMEASV